MGRKASRHRSKLAPKRKGKTPVGGRRYPSNNNMGRNKVWQEKAKKNPTEPVLANAHIRFESSPSSSLSNHANVEVPGDQALRLQYLGDVGNTINVEDSSDEEIHDVESSSESRVMDLNTIIPDSLVDEGSGMCAEACQQTARPPLNFVRPLSPPPPFLYLPILIFHVRELWKKK